MNNKIYLIATPNPQLKKIVKKYAKLNIGLVQYRDKFSSDNEYVKNANEIIKICHKYHINVIINDRKHLLPRVNADGIQLPFEEMDDIKNIKKEFPNIVIMTSVHNEIETKEAISKGTNIVSLGSMFPSPTESEYERASLGSLSKIKKITTEIAVVGGINDKNINRINPTSYKWIGFTSYLVNNKSPKKAINKIHKEQSEYAKSVIARYINYPKKIVKLQGGVSSNINFKIVAANNESYHLKLLNLEVFTHRKIVFMKKYFKDMLIAVNSEFLIKRWITGSHKVLHNDEYYQKLLSEVNKIHSYEDKKLDVFDFNAYDSYMHRISKKLQERFYKLEKAIKNYEYVTLHGDINEKNIVNQKNSPKFIDFEWLSRGPEIIDYGYMILFLDMPIDFFVKNTKYSRKDLKIAKDFLSIHTMLWAIKENTHKSEILYQKMVSILEGENVKR